MNTRHDLLGSSFSIMVAGKVKEERSERYILVNKFVHNRLIGSYSEAELNVVLRNG